MAFEPAILSLMASTATYKPFTGLSGYGTESFGTTSIFRCHITYRKKIIRTNTEEDAVSTAQIQLPPGNYQVGNSTTPTPTIAIDDHIILPDGTERRVLDVSTYTDDTGPNHQSVSLT